MSDDFNFPNIREYMRDRHNQFVEEPEPVPTDVLEDIAKQLRIANLIAYRNSTPRDAKDELVREEIEHGLVWP